MGMTVMMMAVMMIMTVVLQTHIGQPFNVYRNFLAKVIIYFLFPFVIRGKNIIFAKQNGVNGRNKVSGWTFGQHKLS